MTEINTKTLQEGMLFSSPLLFDDGKNMFLAERMPIGKIHLDTVRRWNIEKVITYGKPIDSEDDGLDELEMLDEVDDDVEDPLLSLYMTAIKNMEDVFNAYNNNEALEKKLIDESVKIIYSLVTEEKSFAVGISFLPVKNHLPLVVNAVNIAFTSSIIATEMKFPAKDILHLITAALLHDIDMIKQPEKVLNKPGRLSDEEYSRIQAHSQKVISTILETLSYPKEIALIALQHHERWDGKGYPEGKKDQQIYLPARVLAVADSFEAMLSEKAYRSAFIAHDAVKTLLAEKEKKYDPAVLKAFISSIGLYPVGSHVLLSDGSIAKIAQINVDAPFFPTVRICLSKTPDLPVNSLLDLKGQSDLTITRAVKQSEVSSLA